MELDHIVAVLRRTELFGQLGEPALKNLSGRVSTRTVQRGRTIFVEDEPGDRLYVLAEGIVRIVVYSSRGDEVELVRRQPPEVFGELAILDGGPRSASAEAVEQAMLIGVTRDDVLSLLRSDVRVAEALLSSLGALVRRTTRQWTGHVFLTLDGRLAGKLLELARAGGDPSDEQLRANRVTQTELANMVGGARQSVNDALQRFRKRGFIRIDRGVVEILKPDELRKRAGE